MTPELTTLLCKIDEAHTRLQLKRATDAKLELERLRKPITGARISTAAGILRWALKRLKWTRQWTENKLSGLQHLQLLNTVRQYARAWMRREAQEWVEANLQPDESGQVPRISDDILGFLVSGLFSRFSHFVGESLHAGVKSLAGPGQITPSMIKAVVNGQAKQAEYMNGFHKDFVFSVRVIMGTHFEGSEVSPMSPAQMVARAEMYGNAPWETAVNGGRGVVLDDPDQVFIAERRVHNLPLSEHNACQTCLDQSELGWQPLGTLAEIGDSECLGNCDCYYEWQDDGADTYVSPWGRHNPKNLGADEPGFAYPPMVHVGGGAVVV